MKRNIDVLFTFDNEKTKKIKTSNQNIKINEGLLKFLNNIDEYNFYHIISSDIHLFSKLTILRHEIKNKEILKKIQILACEFNRPEILCKFPIERNYQSYSDFLYHCYNCIKSCIKKNSKLSYIKITNIIIYKFELNDEYYFKELSLKSAIIHQNIKMIIYIHECYQSNIVEDSILITDKTNMCAKCYNNKKDLRNDTDIMKKVLETNNFTIIKWFIEKGYLFDYDTVKSCLINGSFLLFEFFRENFIYCKFNFKIIEELACQILIENNHFDQIYMATKLGIKLPKNCIFDFITSRKRNKNELKNFSLLLENDAEKFYKDLIYVLNLREKELFFFMLESGYNNISDINFEQTSHHFLEYYQYDDIFMFCIDKNPIYLDRWRNYLIKFQKLELIKINSNNHSLLLDKLIEDNYVTPYLVF